MIKQVKGKKHMSEEERERDKDLKSIYKVGYGPLPYYKHYLRKAITDSFPEIGVYLPSFISLSDNIFFYSITPKKTSKYVLSRVSTASLFIYCIQTSIGIMLTTEENFSLSSHCKIDLIL